MIDSAGNWTKGEPTPRLVWWPYYNSLLKGYESASKTKLPPFLVIPEEKGVSTRQYSRVTSLYWRITEGQQYFMEQSMPSRNPRFE